MHFDYHFEGDVLYWGRLNNVFVKSDFLEEEQINYGVELKALTNCIVDGIYPLVTIIPVDRPICSIEVYYKKELKLTKHFIVSDVPNPMLTSEELRNWADERTTGHDEIIHSQLDLADFLKIKRIQAKVIDATGNAVLLFNLTQFKFSVLREREILFETINTGEELNKNILDFAVQIRRGDKLLFENVVCHLSEVEKQIRIDKNFNYNIVTIK